MLSASHTYILDRMGNVLTWLFNNIELPASINDAGGAKGFVHFKVKPKAGYAVGDIIPNAASIFFDFNPAIVTDAFETEFVEMLSAPGFDANGFAMFPNPAKDRLDVQTSGDDLSAITVYDMVGKVVIRKAPSGSHDTVDVSGLGSGMYLVEITTTNQAGTVKKLVVE
jgi:hypothetical protein